MDPIAQMNEAKLSESVFLLSYLKLKRNKGDVICFFEGIFDPFYYRCRIEAITGKSLKYVICENKAKVFAMYKLSKCHNVIKQDKKKCSLAFFVDKDFDENIANPEISVTVGYSIENYYSNPNTFSKIIRELWHIDEDSDSYSTLKEFYNKNFGQFHDTIRNFNAFYRVVKQKYANQKINLGCKFDDTNLADIKVGKCLAKYSLDSLNELYNVSVSKDELEASREVLYNNNEYYSFRGKYELSFFIMLLRNIQNKVNRKELNIETKIQANFNDNTFMSDFCQYAEYPKELHAYILNCYNKAQKFIKKNKSAS